MKKINKSEFEKFLKNFPISPNKITKLINLGKIIYKNDNYFLIEDLFLEGEIYKDYLLFLKIEEELCPSMFLLNWIYYNSDKKIYLKNEKNALNFTYSKNISSKDIINKEKFINGKNYIVVFNNIILGYCQIRGKKLINKFNIGKFIKQ